MWRHWQILYFLIIKAFQYSIKILILPPLSYKKKKRPAKFSVENLIGRFVYLAYVILFSCVRCFFYFCDSCFFHWDSAVFVVSELYDDIVVCDIDDYAVETACCDDCIADCEVIQHCLQFFLALSSAGGSLRIHHTEHDDQPHN